MVCYSLLYWNQFEAYDNLLRSKRVSKQLFVILFVIIIIVVQLKYLVNRRWPQNTVQVYYLLFLISLNLLLESKGEVSFAF